MHEESPHWRIRKFDVHESHVIIGLSVAVRSESCRFMLQFENDEALRAQPFPTAHLCTVPMHLSRYAMEVDSK